MQVESSEQVPTQSCPVQIGAWGDVQSMEVAHCGFTHVPAGSQTCRPSQPMIESSPNDAHWTALLQHDAGLCFVHASKRPDATSTVRRNLFVMVGRIVPAAVEFRAM